MVGFPPGFQLRPGERVAVFGEPIARPLVETRVGPVDVKALEARERVSLAGREFALQSSTILYDAHSDQGVLWIVDPGDCDGPPQVIAARRAR